MKIIRSLTAPNELQTPVALSIGNFDGVHRGHRAVLKNLTTLSKSEKIPSVVLTFENHPSEILRPGQTILRLCTLKHRLKLLDEAGVDTVALLPFTREFSKQTAEEFLKSLQKNLPFSHLVLGHDATLGRERQGDRKRVEELSKNFSFIVNYLDQLTYEGVIVSSSKIRELIQQGDLGMAEKLLGRKYSIYSSVQPGLGHGKKIGFPTANIEVGALCLPPYGVYAVRLLFNKKVLPGVANLGLAPTVRNDDKPILEVHLLDSKEDLYGKDVEAVFQEYIRPEMKFPNIDELKQQIGNDVEKAKAILK